MPSKGVIHCALCVTLLGNVLCMSYILPRAETPLRWCRVWSLDRCSPSVQWFYHWRYCLMSGPRVISVKHPIRRTEERHAMKLK